MTFALDFYILTFDILALKIAGYFYAHFTMQTSARIFIFVHDIFFTYRVFFLITVFSTVFSRPDPLFSAWTKECFLIFTLYLWVFTFNFSVWGDCINGCVISICHGLFEKLKLRVFETLTGTFEFGFFFSPLGLKNGESSYARSGCCLVGENW